MHPPTVSIIIPYWKDDRYIFRCLQEIENQVVENLEVVIVVNGSIEGSIDSLESQFPNLNITIQQLESNLGFAIANNIGAQMARGRWIALLNADAFPEPDWLEKLLKAAEENPEYSFFSSRQIQANSPDILDGAGDAYHVSGLAWRHGYNYPAVTYAGKQKEVFSACAAAALISREDFWAMGGFDEDFFSYFEDVDLGFRLRLAGKKCMYVHNAIVHHVGSASTGKKSDFSVYYGYRNLIWTFIKNMPSPLIWFYLPVHISTILFFVFYLTLRGQGETIIRAIIDAVRGLSKMLEKRKDIQNNMAINPFQLLQVMSTRLFDPYREFRRRNQVK